MVNCGTPCVVAVLLVLALSATSWPQALEEVHTDDNGNTIVLTDDGAIEVVAAEKEDNGEADDSNEEAQAEFDIAVDAVVAELVEDAVVVDGEGIIGQAVEGVLQVFGAKPQRFAKPKQASQDALTKNVDEIDSLEELRKLEKELKADQNIKQMHQRLTQQINAFRDVEVHFLHLVCNLKKSEFKKINKAVELETLRCVVLQCQKYGQQFRPVRRRDRIKDEDIKTPAQRFVTAIKESAKDLGDDRFAAYEQELKARHEFRKEAMVGMLVTALDQLFHLDGEQREEMKTIMTDNWTDSWTLQTAYFANIEYMGGLPQKEIQKVLTDKQKAIHRSINWMPQNVNQFIWNQQVDMFGFAQMRGRGVRLERQLKFAAE